MKKITLLTTATLVTAAFISGQSLTAQAATITGKELPLSGKQIIIASNISQIQDIFDKIDTNHNIQSLIKNYLQNLPSDFPCPPVELPDVETPDTTPDTPEVDKPEVDKPGTENPGADKPGADKPGTENPDNSKPEVDNPDSDKPETDNPAYVKRVVELVNNERAKEGLAPLSVDANVAAAAQVRAHEIEHSFSHTRPNGTSFSTALKEQNVSYKRAGENIAWGQRSPEEVVDAWMNSAGHRANIMNANFTKIGVGYYRNTKGTNYWSQLFIQ